MKRSFTQRLPRALPFLLLALGIGAAPVAAQAGGQQSQERYKVLVANLQPANGADKGFGEDVSKETTKLIGDMATHQPVDRDDLKKALKKYGLKDEDLDCIKSRQLAIQMNVQLVMCGTYTPDRQITARFISSDKGETYDVPPFQSSDAKQAAQQIFQSFHDYVGQLAQTAYCYDYLNSSQWPAAVESCDKALTINPKSATALYGKARALMQMDSLSQALDLLDKVLVLNPADQDAMKTAGVVAAKLNRNDAARKYFHDYLQLNPGDVDVRLTVANDLANAGDPEGALRIAQEANDSANLTLTEYIGHFALATATKEEQNQGADGQQAVSPQAMELYNTALAAYRKVYAAKGDSADSQMLRNMISVLVQLDRTDEAKQLGQKITATKKDDPQIWYAYAIALNKSGDLNGALDAMGKALQLDPTVRNAYALEGQWLVQAGKISQARQVFDKALAAQQTPEDKANLSDQLAQVVFATGYRDKFQKGARDAAINYFDLAADYATQPRTKGMANFFHGYALYLLGVDAAKPQNLAAAKKALPLFQAAKPLLKAGEPYARTDSSIDLAKILGVVDQYIDIQQLIIKRGH